jgi:hypothetical protein
LPKHHTRGSAAEGSNVYASRAEQYWTLMVSCGPTCLPAPRPFSLPVVAHILQQGDMYGEGESPIRPEQLTSEVARGSGGSFP